MSSTNLPSDQTATLDQILPTFHFLDTLSQGAMSASLAPECNAAKERYDTCFLKWYSEIYLKQNTGSSRSSASVTPLPIGPGILDGPIAKRPNKESTGTPTQDPCQGLFSTYSGCLRTALKERGIDKMLEDAHHDLKAEDP